MSEETKRRKKLIEVAMPLEAINKEALHRKFKAPKGWPTSFHKWWAQRPLAAARSVIFAQIVDDPSGCTELFPNEETQERERQRLFALIEDLIKWENTGNERILEGVRAEIWNSWRRACSDNANHPEAKDIFNPQKLPAFYDPFAGSGSLPLSAQWLGLSSFSGDLNPVAVLINKAVIEIPRRFNHHPPVNAESIRQHTMQHKVWRGAQGLAADIRFYGRWMRGEASKRIGHLYPTVEITDDLAKDRPDLRPLVGRDLTVIAWIWARTVKSPNPAFGQVEIPLASTFLLSTKPGKEAYVEPIIENASYRFVVRSGKPRDLQAAKRGTKSGGSGSSFFCLMSGVPVPFEYLRAEAKAGRMGARLLAVVAEGERGRVFLSPTDDMPSVALLDPPKDVPDTDLPAKALGFRVQEYGMTKWRDLFTSRQLMSLTTFSDLVSEARERIKEDATASGMSDDGVPLRQGGTGATAYSEGLVVYLACAVSRMAYYGSTLTTWLPKDSALRDCMPRQALAMTWDYAEGNPFGKSSGDISTVSNVVANYLDVAVPDADASAVQCDAQKGLDGVRNVVISTDPPYYDNIGYADLSDFFYVWLRRCLRPVFPDLFSTVAVPKSAELVATPFRYGTKEQAESFFLSGMTSAMSRLAEQSHPAVPVTIYYAFKQSESDDDEGLASTGWETFLSAVIAAGFAISGTWPLRTEREGRLVASGTNALASSILLVCHARETNAGIATRREFLTLLRKELPVAVTHLQRGNIAPVDLAQAAIGPGMEIYTRFAKVLDAEGKALTVRDALALINQTLDEVLAEQEGDFDADTRWALAWFDQVGFEAGEYGVAEMLSKAKNTSVQRMKDAGILDKKSAGGKVRLLRPNELPIQWDPIRESRLSIWEAVHHLLRRLESEGEEGAADLVSLLGGVAEVARELAYRLYTISERKKRAQEALSYNALVQSWPEITRLARQSGRPVAQQREIFEQA